MNTPDLWDEKNFTEAGNTDLFSVNLASSLDTFCGVLTYWITMKNSGGPNTETIVGKVRFNGENIGGVVTGVTAKGPSTTRASGGTGPTDVWTFPNTAGTTLTARVVATTGLAANTYARIRWKLEHDGLQEVSKIT